MEDFSAEGNIHFWIRQPGSKKWMTNKKRYHFPKLSVEGSDLAVTATKNPNGTLSIAFTTPSGSTVNFLAEIPKKTGLSAILIDLTWKAGGIILYLNGDQVAEQSDPARAN